MELSLGRLRAVLVAGKIPVTDPALMVLSDGLSHWWQACSELDLPGYDALDPDSANINLAIGVEAADLVSGAAAHLCYPCQIEKLV